MSTLDYLVLIGVMVGIAVYGMWRTRAHGDLHTYLKGAGNTHWLTIGLSVMATQASAITFLSTPGQGYESGIGFVQNYFGAPLALIIIAAVFLPIYRRLNVYTAYEYLGKRFDAKTRLLYAPAIVLSSVMGWRLDYTIICSGLLVIAYTVSGGSSAVNLTQKYQIGVIFIGMFAALVVLLMKLPAGLGFTDALAVAGGYHKLEAVDFSLDPDRRYTIWTGVLGGMFLALSYFGTDQSQVQRYLTGSSLRESRLGLMFNAVLKIPMQLFILLLGALVFVFYQFERPPVFFNQAAWHYAAEHGSGDRLRQLENEFNSAHAEKQRHVEAWLAARHAGDANAVETERTAALAANARTEAARVATKEVLHSADAKVVTNDSDYVFITFILSYLPHGLIGLLVAVIFAATFASKAGELNALASTTVVDFYRHVIKTDATDKHYVVATKCFTALWGFVAIGFALFAHLAENLIQATNIIGSIFYGVVLGMFLVAFFLRKIVGTAVFWAAMVAQALVFILYFSLSISYLWYNFIGPALCVGLSLVIQMFLPAKHANKPS